MGKSEDLLLVGVDLGTSGVRVDVYGVNGEVLASGRAPIKKQTTDEWLRAVKEAFPSKFLREKKGKKLVSVDSTSGTVVLVDEQGSPLIPPLMYYEKAEEEVKELYKFELVKQLASKGFRLSATSPLAKILKVKREKPAVFKRVRWIVPAATWLLYKLYFEEGESWRGLKTDWTNALKVGEDITEEKPKWFMELFEKAGIPADLLPEITSPGDPIGEAKSKLARELGLENATLYQGMTDGNAAALGSGCVNLWDCAIGCGTTSVPKLVCSQMKPHPAIYYHKHPVQGYLASAAYNTSVYLKWFSERVLGLNVEEALKLAEKIPPGREYLFIPPGDRNPFHVPFFASSFVNVWPDEAPINEVKGRFVRGVLLGIAVSERFFIDLFERLFQAKIRLVNLTGGAARNRFWNLIRASIYGKPVRVMEERVTAGVLIPVVLKEKVYGSAEEAVETLLKEEYRLNPDQNLEKAYSNLARNFGKAWVKLKDFYETLLKGE